jgi:hypothetical protein
MFYAKKSYLGLLFCCAITLNACKNPAAIVTVQSAKPSASSSPVVINIPVANITPVPVVPAPGTIDNIKPVTPNLQEGPNTIGTKPISPVGSSNPIGQTGGTSDIKERATFNGKVYNFNGVVVEGAKVTAKSLDPNVSWLGEEQITTNGSYVFRNAPVGARVEITVYKDGWTSRTRTEVLKSNLQGDPTANVFDFGGLGASGLDQSSLIYAIQDEPEITGIKVNGRKVETPGKNGKAGLSGVNRGSLEIEFTFSEPVVPKETQESFRLNSLFINDAEDVEFNYTSTNVSFIWN